ncbi:methionine aminopeptidase 2B-like isoform X3 [Camellia sinensis]|uniref:methionine aminopeptidase 2B-like isoform X3 n=1 Tax=Camellia sinensis TaxID=4442 RepID=UPI001036B983|nr:methionine aminopeptidase 2B-like isoform X3 [Camellia sinensis]
MKMGTMKICKSGPQWVDHLDTNKFTIWTTISKSDGSIRSIDSTTASRRIVDYAFTVAFNPMFRHLLEASQEATNIGILVLLKILKAGMILFWCIMHSSSTHVNYSYFLKCNLWLNYK